MREPHPELLSSNRTYADLAKWISPSSMARDVQRTTTRPMPPTICTRWVCAVVLVIHELPNTKAQARSVQRAPSGGHPLLGQSTARYAVLHLSHIFLQIPVCLQPVCATGQIKGLSGARQGAVRLSHCVGYRFVPSPC